MKRSTMMSVQVKSAETGGGLRTLLFGMLLVLCSAQNTSTHTPLAPKESARQVIENTTLLVTRTLKNQALKDLEKQDEVIAVVNKRVDFETVSKLVLARGYRKFSKDQREQFISEFRHHLLLTYWNNATLFEFESVEIVGERKEKRNDWTVKTLIHTTHEDAKIDYRLRLRGASEKTVGEWKIIDVIIEGVSLVSNFRSQFQSLVANRGPEGLLELLRKKNAEEGKAAKAETSDD